MIKWFSARVPRPLKRVKAIIGAGAGETGDWRAKDKVGPYFTPDTKIHPKWIKHLNVRPKSTKLLEEKIGKKLHDTGFVSRIDFLKVTSKT